MLGSDFVSESMSKNSGYEKPELHSELDDYSSNNGSSVLESSQILDSNVSEYFDQYLSKHTPAYQKTR